MGAEFLVCVALLPCSRPLKQFAGPTSQHGQAAGSLIHTGSMRLAFLTQASVTVVPVLCFLPTSFYTNLK